ncbi:protein yellow-like [Pieris rapae]|uniref:protein yellow-like n=1 Tax=Pieris rapae TaxID=64459 RepID=UPI001E27E6A0|nr:protein yellow-like [Pieris rapae]
MLARFLILGCLLATISATVKLRELYSWNVLDWNYPDLYSKQRDLDSGALNPKNALPVGIERWRNKLFVSVPRWFPGIPATLNYISLDAPYEPSPKLTPYPSFKENELGNCENGLTTVYRIKADKCDRLWVLDVGTYGYDPNVTNVCPYALSVYDLHTNQRLRRYVFRSEDIVPTTFIANIALDEGDTCEDYFAYFSDELGYGLITYSWEQNKSWRFSHGFFLPDPLVGDFNIAGMNFQWISEGIFGISASPKGPDGYRTLYFSPITSNTEFAVSTRILRDETKVKGSYKDFKVVGSRGPDTHTTAKVVDETGVQLYNLIDQNAIGCWNTQLPMKPQNTAVVDRDDVSMIFPCDVKVDGGRNVWVISDRMSIFLESELDYSDINFRIFTANFDDLVRGTVCDPSITTYQQPNYRNSIPIYQNFPSSTPRGIPGFRSSLGSVGPQKFINDANPTFINYNAQQSQPYVFPTAKSLSTTRNPWWTTNNYSY